MSVVAIVGSAFSSPVLDGVELEWRELVTEHGPAVVHRLPGREAYLLARHGLPHRLLPHQIPWRAHAAALKALDCRALLVTSSVGVLDPQVPLDVPLLVSDLWMPDNRLPDGSPCTMWPEPTEDHAHLVLDEGLISAALVAQVEALGVELGWTSAPRVRFAYVPGPRTKTALENQILAGLGLQVNSMSVGPELVLANELGIPSVAVVVGHKPSEARSGGPGLGAAAIDASLVRSREGLARLVRRFLETARPVPFGNRLHRLG